MNGERAFESWLFGWPRTVTYCREEGPSTLWVTAADSSGNESGPSNSLVFSC